MRSRLLALVAFCALLLVAVLAVPAALTMRDSTIRGVDDDLKDVAQALAVYLLSDPEPESVHEFAASLSADAFAEWYVEDAALTFSIVDGQGLVFGDAEPAHPAPLTRIPAIDDLSAPSDLVPVVTVVDGFRVARVAFHNGDAAGVVFANFPESAISQAVWRRVGVLAAATAAALTLSLLAASFLAGRIARTIRHSVRTAEQLGDGLRDVPVPQTGPAELVDLGRAHRRLATQIDDLLQRERHRSAEISHRLRTPLTAVQLATERLVAARPGIESTTEGSTLTRRLKELEDELDQVILETKAAAHDGPSPTIDLAATIRAGLDFWLPMATGQQRTARVDLPDRPVLVRVPEADVHTAFDTLLGNVFRHTEPGVGFEIGVQAVGGQAVLRISDDGAGRVVTPPTGRRSGSTGLGRIVAAGVAERAGGTLSITEDDRGTTAVLSVPLALP